VRHTTYDREHALNRILFKTLNLITQLTISPETMTDVQFQLIYFPELKDISVSDEFFRKIKWNRKTEDYKKAINIARLLLLNYHPDLSHGKNHVLALMFDMNDVWEGWFTRRLAVASKKLNGRVNIRVQTKKTFWTGSTGERVRQKPDIIIEVDGVPRFILDTKWKIISNRPSEDDLRQMFTYNRLFGTGMAYLVYPGEGKMIDGEFYDSEENGQCGLSFIQFIENCKLTGTGVESFARNLFESTDFKSVMVSAEE
jgi:5-methylcytosine-specific restriction enzyme subunit McrC